MNFFLKISAAAIRISRRTASSLLITQQTVHRNMSSNFPGNTVQVGEFLIHYEKVGSGKNCIFLMPGALGTTRTDFGPQLDKLDQKKWTLIAWDPPGYGYSRPPERTFPLDFFQRDADVAVQLLEKVLPPGVNDTAVVGWSDGGITALIMAATHPKIVKRLVVLGANAYLTPEDLQCYEGVRDVTTWSPRMRAPMEQLYGPEYFKVMWNEWLDVMAAIHREKGGDICKNIVPMIACPTMVMHGKKDDMVPQFHADFLRENIKNVRYIELEDGKHNFHLKYADLFNREVEKFLSD